MSVVRAFLLGVRGCLSLCSVLCFVCLFVWVDYSLFPFFGQKKKKKKKKTLCQGYCKNDFKKFIFRVEPCCAGLFSFFLLFEKSCLYLGEEKKSFLPHSTFYA